MLLNISPKDPSPKKMEMVHECLKDGGVIIYPTDTIYALGCDLLNKKAIDKVAAIKGVKPEKANFSLIFNDLSLLSHYTKQVNTPSFKILKKALPGPFTFILQANSNIPKIFHNKKKTVGIRIPDNRITRQLVEDLGNPLISTSVHHEDEILEYPTDPEEIHEKFSKRVDIVINGGVGNNVASTVVDLTGEEPELIRQGAGELETYV